MEKSKEIKRSELWQKIYLIVSQIPRKEIVNGDFVDASSASTEIEKLIISQPSARIADPLSVRADAVYNKRKAEDERNFERAKEMLNGKKSTIKDSKGEQHIFNYQLPIDFLKWYSGMSQEQIIKAHERYLIEVLKPEK